MVLRESISPHTHRDPRVRFGPQVCNLGTSTWKNLSNSRPRGGGRQSLLYPSTTNRTRRLSGSDPAYEG